MKKNQPKTMISIVTIIATFLMGFLDAYTFTEQNHVFASAQTGNMVAFGAKLVNGQWQQTAANIAVFAGFAIGGFSAEIVLARSYRLGLRRFQVFFSLQAILLLILALFQLQLGSLLIVFCLGLLSGYVLTTFHQIGDTTVNSGIMTGNTKNLMNRLYLVLFEKDKKAKKDLVNLLTGIAVFILGVAAGALVIQINPLWNLWAAFLIVCGTVVWLLTQKNIRS